MPLALAAPLFGAGAVLAVIGLYTIATASAALGGPAWGSLLADYTDPTERGAYFGRRARITAFAAGVASLAAGAALHLSEGRGALGFGLLCAGAGVARALSWRALSRFHDGGTHDEPHLDTSFAGFLRSARRSNFARFSLCMALNSLAAAIAAPFFAVYLLEEGHYSYPVYTAVILAGSVTGMLSAPWWGRLGDRAGNHAVLRWTLTGVSILPALWVVSLHPLWMLGANVLGAFLWGGLNLSATNFVYDAVSAARRHTSIAWFNVLNGIGLGVGAFAGAYLLEAAQALPAKPFAVLFYVSVLLRIAAAIAFGRTVFEVREVRQVGLREVMLDLVGQRLVGVLGFLSVRPEQEQERRRRNGA
ncbi:MAG: hypothetical protein DCC71_16635 [Proteobacteria bacterium]|nr:MAG: hypothetical protein DCC71_16635 [Pseudomonadota bacterium]